MRRGTVAACLTLLLFLPVRALAQETDGVLMEETQRLLEEMDLSSIQEQAPELDVQSILRSAAQGGEEVDGEALWQAVRGMALGSVRELVPRMLRIVGVSVLCAGLLQLRVLSEKDSLTGLLETLAYLSLALPAAADCAALFAQGREVTQRMADFYSAVLPTMLSLLTAIGGTRSALLMEQLSLAATGGLTRFVQSVLMGALGLCAALTVVQHVAPEIRLGRTMRALRTGVHWALGLCFTAFLGLITVQGMTGAHYDGVTVRTAKYAIDKFVPVVGGAFKDTADTLIGCSIVVKNAVGVVGLAGLLAIMLRPCAGILCTVAAYRACAAALEPLGCGRIGSALSDFADILTTLFIIIISVSAMFFVFLAELMRIGMGFV